MQDRNYYKVRRGMVFYYNINNGIDKYRVPPVKVLGKDRCDYRQYGDRPFVVISSDETCLANHTVCVCPMGSVQPNGRQFPYRTYFNYGPEIAEVMCEQVYTVNVSELVRYDSLLSEDIMREIDEKVAMNLGLSKPRISTDRASLKEIENIIQTIIQNQVDSLTKNNTPLDNVDIDDAVLRIGEGLTDLLGMKVDEIKNETEVDYKPRNKTYNKNRSNNRMSRSSGRSGGRNLDEVYQRKCDPTIEPIEKSKGRIQWTEPLIIEFMHDYETYDYNTLMRKYGVDSKAHLQQMKSRLLKKLDKE